MPPPKPGPATSRVAAKTLSINPSAPPCGSSRPIVQLPAEAATPGKCDLRGVCQLQKLFSRYDQCRSQLCPGDSMRRALRYENSPSVTHPYRRQAPSLGVSVVDRHFFEPGLVLQEV